MMGRTRHIMRKLAVWRRRESGATAVEFVIILPVMLLTFAVIVEGSRLYWNYQAAVAGVRDASRYLARITNNDVCNGGGAPSGTVTTATNIINRSLGSGATNLFPSGVSLASGTPVSTTVVCRSVAGTGFTTFTAPTWRVDATVQVALPLSVLWGFFLSNPNGTMTSTITDQTRIYGL